jgi:ATP-dependent Clp protease protease subunit
MLKFNISDSDCFIDRMYVNCLNERKIIFNDEVGELMVEKVIMPILLWNEEDKDLPIENRKKITLYVNTPGGQVPDGFSACNVIETSTTPIEVITLGMAASMGAYLAMSGTKGLRKCYSFSTFLIHSGSMMLSGNTNDVESTVKYYKDMKVDIEEFIYRHTKISPETYKKFNKEEWYINAKTALELGIVDEII